MTCETADGHAWVAYGVPLTAGTLFSDPDPEDRCVCGQVTWEEMIRILDLRESRPCAESP